MHAVSGPARSGASRAALTAAQAAGAGVSFQLADRYRDPRFVVASNGEFIRVENIAAVRKVVSEIRGGVQQQSDLPPGVEDLLSQLTSEPILTRLAAQEWNLLVASWSDLPMTPALYEADRQRTDGPSGGEIREI
jgi:hypothetical protein